MRYNIIVGVALAALLAVSAGTGVIKIGPPAVPAFAAPAHSLVSQVAAPATNPIPLIAVTGEGTATSAPDIAHVSLGVQSNAATAGAASTANASAMQAVITAVKALGIPDKDIQTEGYSIYPIYATNGGQESQTITGYRVTNGIAITVETPSQTGAIVDAGVQAGANTGVSISFGLKDNTALQEQALTLAFQQAQAKASALAKAMGVTLTGAYTVSESGTSLPVTAGQAAPRAQSAAASTPVELGQLAVNSQVEVTFQYSR